MKILVILALILGTQVSFAQKQCGGVFLNSTKELVEHIQDTYQKLLEAKSELATETLQHKLSQLISTAESRGLFLEDILNSIGNEQSKKEVALNHEQKRLEDLERKKLFLPQTIDGVYQPVNALFSGSKAFLLRKDFLVDIFDMEKMEVVDTWKNDLNFERWKRLSFWGNGRFALLYDFYSVTETMHYRAYDLQTKQMIYEKKYRAIFSNVVGADNSGSIVYNISTGSRWNIVSFNPENGQLTNSIKNYSSISNWLKKTFKIFESYTTTPVIHSKTYPNDAASESQKIVAAQYKNQIHFYSREYKKLKTIKSKGFLYNYLHNQKNHEIYLVLADAKFIVLDDKTFEIKKEIKLESANFVFSEISFRDEFNSLVIIGPSDAIILNVQTWKQKWVHRESRMANAIILNEDRLVMYCANPEQGLAAMILHLIDTNTQAELKRISDTPHVYIKRILNTRYAIAKAPSEYKIGPRILDLEALEYVSEPMPIKNPQNLEVSPNADAIFSYTENPNGSVTRTVVKVTTDL